MNIPKINSRLLLSGASIAAAAALVVGATFAFFSDTETSTGNAIAAGEIDLKVDNTCYYNGQACTKVLDANGVSLGSYWGGVVAEGNQCSCSWELDDLTEQQFFDLEDVKPGDWEEDTISLHAGSNDAWLCADVTLTSDADNDCTEPEDADDPNCAVGDLPSSINGDLADDLRFIWWADDGDNVLEEGETTLPSGALGNANVGQTITVDLADSNNNIWNPGPSPSPFPGEATKYIGKGWCFGDITLDPVTPSDNNSPTVDPGFDCDGEPVDNAAQTDSVEMDISFRAIQARNNASFECNVPSPSPSPS